MSLFSLCLQKINYIGILLLNAADKSAKKPDSEEIDGEKKFENMSNLSWLSSVSQSNVLLQWKEQSRKKNKAN